MPDKDIPKSNSATLAFPLALRYLLDMTNKNEPITKIENTRYKKLKVSPKVCIITGN